MSSSEFNTPFNAAQRVKQIRTQSGMSQRQFADLLGVPLSLLQQWERGKVQPAPRYWRQLVKVETEDIHGPQQPFHQSILHETPSPYTSQTQITLPDFSSPPDRVHVVVEGEHLTYAHMVNPMFATEISAIVPLPHQRIAVYDAMLGQSRLRFMLADDAGAGKTIMTGLYIREMLTRRLISRVLIVPPAGLVGNWEHEMHTLFDLPFRIASGSDAKNANPFVGPESSLLIVSVDTLRGKTLFSRLQEGNVLPYDLVIFDEAHKLAVDREADLRLRKTGRYRLAEALAGVQTDDEQWMLSWNCHHLLLLTATPHMGKEFPYYGLWRLLEPDVLATIDAFHAYPPDARKRHFIRRSKEELVDFEGRPIYPPRITNTLSYDLSQGEISEQTLYEETTRYIQSYYNRSTTLNRSAVRLAMSVFQRRLASSTYALLRSFERRKEKLEQLIADIASGKLDEERLQILQLRLDALEDTFAEKTADEEEARGGQEENERQEEQALAGVVATTVADLEVELHVVEGLLDLTRRVYALSEEAKFERLREILLDKEYKNEKMIIFTEHRDTLQFLVRRLEGMGFAGRIAQIHGGMEYGKREEQVALFRSLNEESCATYLVATDAAGEGINLQVCHLMVNYDIPWNPARLEQRMGRIHRFGQKHPVVYIMNLVAGKTREGRVMKTILEKLEAIRKELGSDKVFDVIGQLFEGVSLRDYMEQAVLSNDVTERALQRRIDGTLTKEQVVALEAREHTLYGDGGAVRRELPRLRTTMDQETFRHVLPGYVRRFLEKAAPLLSIALEGDLDGIFTLHALQDGVLDWLFPLLEWYPPQARNAFTVRIGAKNDNTIFLHPGEPVFDRFQTYVCNRFAPDALRGALFVDPMATQPYFFHVAKVTIRRQAAADLRVLQREELLISQLIGLKQTQNGVMEQCTIEQLLFLHGANDLPPALVSFATTIEQALSRAKKYTYEQIALPLVEEQRRLLVADAATREKLIVRSFTYQGAEMADSRRKITERVNRGEGKLRGELTKIRERQRQLEARKQEALNVIRREPTLIAADEVTFVAHALVVPSHDEEQRQRYNADIEAIAVQVASAYEEEQGATVQDVSIASRALAAGLREWPGFDLLSHRSSGETIAIEVKGRADIGDVELSENEFVQACNLRDRYWLYVVFECAKAFPRLCRIQDPFGKLIYSEKKRVIIDEAAIFAVEEKV